MGPGQGPPGSGGSREDGPQPSARGSRSGRLPSRSVDAPGYSWQRLPEQKLLGGVRGEGARGEKRTRGGRKGRGRDSASDVIGSPCASQGGRLNQKNQSGASSGERDVPCAGRRGREAAGSAGPGPAAAAGAGRSRLRSRWPGSGNSLESGSLLVMQKHLGVSRSLRTSFRVLETSFSPPSPIFPVSHRIVPCLDKKRNYIIISIAIITWSVHLGSFASPSPPPLLAIQLSIKINTIRR